jgi:hypothetical protein
MAKKKSKQKWIPKDLDEGAFTAKAKKAGKSVAGYAAQATKPGSKASTKTKRQANLAKTFRKMAKKRKGKK